MSGHLARFVDRERLIHRPIEIELARFGDWQKSAGGPRRAVGRPAMASPSSPAPIAFALIHGDGAPLRSATATTVSSRYERVKAAPTRLHRAGRAAGFSQRPPRFACRI